MGAGAFSSFADDVIIWVTGDFCAGVMDFGLQRALRIAEEWAAHCRLRFSPQKCECICFSAANIRIQREFDARLYGEALPHVHSLRYLGIWYDEHLTWDRHVREVVAHARSRLWELRRYVGSEWGFHPPLVSSHGAGRHYSHIILWGSMLGISLVFEWATCTVGWSFSLGEPFGFWARMGDFW